MIKEFVCLLEKIRELNEHIKHTVVQIESDSDHSEKIHDSTKDIIEFIEESEFVVLCCLKELEKGKFRCNEIFGDVVAWSDVKHFFGEVKERL